MLRKIEEDHCFYILEHDDETDEYFLEVECGTTAVFTIKIKLTAKEIAAHKSSKTSIRALAFAVLDYPKEFSDRRIN